MKRTAKSLKYKEECCFRSWMYTSCGTTVAKGVFITGRTGEGQHISRTTVPNGLSECCLFKYHLWI